MTVTREDTGARSVVAHLRPRYESANIRTWIGFKQFMQLAQEAVLDWFRAGGYGPQRLFHECGVGLRVLDSSVLLPATLEVDDEVTAEVVHTGDGVFTVRLRSGRTRVLRGKLNVALVTESAAEPAGAELPGELRSLLAVPPASSDDPGEPVDFGWDWRVRYFHCHYSDVVQHSTYVAVLEEAVDRYLHAVGLSVPALLAERGWIPVVSRARVTVHGEARMDDVVRTTFIVDDIVGDRAFDGRMTCHVVDGDHARVVAGGTILHGYAVTRGEQVGQLAQLDGETAAMLRGGVQ